MAQPVPAPANPDQPATKKVGEQASLATFMSS